MPEPTPARARRRLPPRVRQALSWLVPPLLATAAIALQISLDVPKGEMLQREEKSKKPKRKTAATRTQLRKKRQKNKHKKPERFKPRSAAKLEELREKWSEAPFEDEPTDQLFRRRHEAVLRAAATQTRAAVLDGSRAVSMQIRPTCRTLRCALELCGPEALLTDIASTLPKLTIVDQPLWHELREVEPTREPAKSKAPKLEAQVCRRWIVDFAVQAPKTMDLRVPVDEDEPEPESEGE